MSSGVVLAPASASAAAPVPGARLRAERELAEHYEVAYGTVRRAMEVLRERRLIETIHGRGTFVTRQ